MTVSHENEWVLITGASTGMGAATARELARRGYHVLAGVRRTGDADTIRTDRIEPILLDITQPETIDAMVERIDRDARRLVALVNNAGISVNSPVETLPLEQWRRQFEVNLFGHIAMTQAMLPFLRRSNGRVVNISSIGGKVALATYGAYAGSKFALEAVSDALRRELAPQGVSVVVVEPGGVQTEMVDRAGTVASALLDGMSAEQQTRYGDLVTAAIDHAADFRANGVTADRAAHVIAQAVTAARPKVRYTIGRDAALLTRAARVLPDRILDRILARNLRPFHPNAQHAAGRTPQTVGQLYV